MARRRACFPPLGSWLVGVVGAGFLAYGVFTVLRVRYARLDS